MLQVELCRKVLRLYQDFAVSWLLDQKSWEYLLSVLLHHTWQLLTHKDTTLGLALANTLLQVHYTVLECDPAVCGCSVQSRMWMVSVIYDVADLAGVLPEGFHGYQHQPLPLG